MKVKDYIVVRRKIMDHKEYGAHLTSLWREFDKAFNQFDKVFEEFDKVFDHPSTPPMPQTPNMPDLSELNATIEELVAEKIKEGYIPIGGVSVIEGYESQAMVKYEESN